LKKLPNQTAQYSTLPSGKVHLNTVIPVSASSIEAYLKKPLQDKNVQFFRRFFPKISFINAT
jgi:hypothetical protein